MPPHDPNLEKCNKPPTAVTTIDSSESKPATSSSLAPDPVQSEAAAVGASKTDTDQQETPVESGKKRPMRRLFEWLSPHIPQVDLKGVLPIIISLAALGVSYYTYRLNVTNAALTQSDLRAKAIDDFLHEDPGKKELAAFKLSQYGPAALPVIRQTLAANEPRIREGAVSTARQIYETQTVSHEKLLGHMLESFGEQNAMLNLGVVEFYLEVAQELTNEESGAFVSLLRRRLGPDGSLCRNETSSFVVAAGRYIGAKSSKEAKEAPTEQQAREFKTLLLGIAQNCPWEKPEEDGQSKYDGARTQAMTALMSVAGRLPKSERDLTVNTLRGLEANENVSDPLKGNIKRAIEFIEKIERP